MATTAQLIQASKDALAVVIAADPATYVDYKIGDKSVSKSQYVDHLLFMIKKLSSADLQGDVELEFVQLDADVNLNGTDQSQYTTLL